MVYCTCFCPRIAPEVLRYAIVALLIFVALLINIILTTEPLYTRQ